MYGLEKVILSLNLRQVFYQAKLLTNSIIYTIRHFSHCPALNSDSFNTSLNKQNFGNSLVNRSIIMNNKLSINFFIDELNSLKYRAFIQITSAYNYSLEINK